MRRVLSASVCPQELTDRRTMAAYFTGNTTNLNAEELRHSAGRHLCAKDMVPHELVLAA